MESQVPDASLKSPYSNPGANRGPGIGSWALAACALAICGLSAAVFPDPEWVLIGTAGLTLFVIASGFIIQIKLRNRHDRVARHAVISALQYDSVPTFLTDLQGGFLWGNDAAHAEMELTRSEGLGDVLGVRIADAKSALVRMREQAMVFGYATETRESGPNRLCLSVNRGDGPWMFWRLDTSAVPKPEIGLPNGIGLMRLDAQGNVISLDPQLAALFGSSPDTLRALLGTKPLRPNCANVVTLAKGPKPMFVHQVQTPDGTDLYFLPMQSNKSQIDSDLFETLPVPLVKLNSGGEIVLANRGARVLLEDDIPRGRRLSELVSGLGRSVSDWLKEASEGRGLNRSEFLQVTKQSKDTFVQVTLKRLPEDDDAELVAVLNDATELKTLEAQFVQSQKMQAIGQLAGGVAHDFNNLLTAISGHCDLLLLRHDQGDPEYADLVQIHQNTNRAASLVGQLLAFSRKQTLQPEVVDLRDTLSELTHLLNRLVGERITLTLNHDPTLNPIRADKRQLEQVIMNLVVNARDAMPKGGEITISTEALTLDHEMERNRASIPAGAYSVVKVIDHGVGIPSDKLTKVFEPFYTTKRTGEGTGLGLSTAYGIVKQTGGFIFVESELNVGTKFTLYFPAHMQKPDVPIASTPQIEIDRTSSGAGVVLLVEDEAPVRAFASRALRLRGYTVLEADSAEQALETLEDADLKVDVFVTDVVMPGMDGPSWVQMALVKRPETRVVFVSGYAEDALADHKSRIPNSVFLPKPFSLNDLTRTVQAQLSAGTHSQ